ncbi:hypothetical protein [Corynebacterium sp. ES2775-CONJ]|uniref:hypothetical protein n=1 Tax=Corynebacterium sp. ES2775-CONJ TaxID=2974029 RepID=UPI0021676FA3|nr:hypothetical protein [Corynebacterium sp. ES2775-CONJ]MCS4489429.1 hypothetical protein [Corynebacterium sp. ES2775-CONJ]
MEELEPTQWAVQESLQGYEDFADLFGGITERERELARQHAANALIPHEGATPSVKLIYITYRERYLGAFWLESGGLPTGEPTGECDHMVLATLRPGRPPTPGDRSKNDAAEWFSYTQLGLWSMQTRAVYEDAPTYGGLYRLKKPLNKGAGDTRGVVQTVHIEPIKSADWDTRFKFKAGDDGFTVRGSKLAPVLWKLVQLGVESVDIRTVRKAIEMNI